MAISDRTTPFAARHTFGTLHNKNIYSLTFGYTEKTKISANASAAAVMASTAGSSSAQTITTGLASLDSSRALSLTVGGSAAGVQSGTIVVTGTNYEGKTITQNFNIVVGGTGTYNGTKAFARITSVFIPAQLGATATFSIGVTNAFGIRHRLFKNNTTVKVYTKTTPYGALTLQGPPTVVADEKDLENNLVTPVGAPDGTKFFIICYSYDNWSLAPVNDQPEYSTTTSTSSTSSSTSTTTITTSTSSTSSSTSSTSVSTSSTSTSTSSTSTSTTTAP